MADITQRVQRVVAETLKIDPEVVVPEARFVEDLGAESVQSIELVAAFEDEFDVDMDEEKALQMKNVADAIVFINSYVET